MSNEEQMRAEFKTWFDGEQGTPYSGMFHFALAAWKHVSASKQREIDALKLRIAVQDEVAGFPKVQTIYGMTADEFLAKYDTLNQQALELSAQVDVMRKFIAEEYYYEHGGEHHDDDCDVCQLIALTPSAALLAHDNEVAAKALEDAAEWFELQSYRETSWIASRAAAEIREMATERRNRK